MAQLVLSVSIPPATKYGLQFGRGHARNICRVIRSNPDEIHARADHSILDEIEAYAEHVRLYIDA